MKVLKETLRTRRRDLATAALLLALTAYMGLVLFMGNATPFLITRGASMEPTYHQGDMLLSRAPVPAEIAVGDVVVFRVPPEARKVFNLPSVAAHRVVGINADGGELVFTTKGDNGEVDSYKVPSSNLKGVVVKNLGRIGWPLVVLTSGSPLLLVLVPILILGLVLLFAATWSKRTEKETDEDPLVTSMRRDLDAWTREAAVGLDTLEGEVARPWSGRAMSRSDYDDLALYVVAGQDVDLEDQWQVILGESALETKAPSDQDSGQDADGDSRTQAVEG